jgi:nucleoside phosphorylase
MPVCTDIQPVTGDDIVITGIAGSYPESENVYQFKDNLFNKVDMVTDDDRRWKTGEFMCFCCRMECHVCEFICLWFV